MLKYELLPVINVDDLTDALAETYPNFKEKYGEVREILFHGDYMNDSYKMLCLDWSFEELKKMLENGKVDFAKIIIFLQGNFPHYNEILVDVSW